ncbi:MAG: aconitase X [Acidimicrobiia bacterium]
MTRLSDRDRALVAGDLGDGPKTAMGLVAHMAKVLGATELVDITSAHIDGCLYHGHASLDFAEMLASSGATVAVPTTLNVTSVDLLHPGSVRSDPSEQAAAKRLMDQYVQMGCEPTWTCAPYQREQRPEFGEQIAWGESNAIVFANSVLGARTERYGDFLDICCAITGRAPFIGLHTTEARRATIRFDLQVDDDRHRDDLLYPLLGGVIGEVSGSAIPVVTGLDPSASEDQLKALGAAAASTGSVGLFHAVGVTPEARTLEQATGGASIVRSVVVDEEVLREAAARIGGASGRLGAVSLGTPHFSSDEFRKLDSLIDGRRTTVPFFVNTSRGVLDAMDSGVALRLVDFGATIVADTCAYLAPIVDDVDGVVLTNSGKAAFYGPSNVAWETRLASLSDCVESAVDGNVVTTGLLS